MKRFGLAALVGLIAIVLSGCGPVAQPTSSAAGATAGTSNGTTSTATPGGATFGPSSATPGSSPAAGGAHGWLIAYIKGSDVFVVNADGGNAVQLTSDGANSAY